MGVKSITPHTRDFGRPQAARRWTTVTCTVCLFLPRPVVIVAGRTDGSSSGAE